MNFPMVRKAEKMTKNKNNTDRMNSLPKKLPNTKEILNDYGLAVLSRQMSIIGRKEVLSGKAKFGILGDGKEIPQIVCAKYFKNGDFRSGYYRDQTLMMALGLLTPEQFFSQLYAHPDLDFDPHSAGRQMNSHFVTRNIDTNGEWLDLVNQKNTSADISCTAGQLPRAVGLALASKLYRADKNKTQSFKKFSDKGNEICFVTIGDASTSEGLFWEAINAAGVLNIPMAVNIWDDGYGISVPREFQTTKGSISELLKGFELDENGNGYYIAKTKAWDYIGLIEMYEKHIPLIRKHHHPAIFHIEEVTQPQGHSTSGSHERYKSKERLEWEKSHDCNLLMRQWIISNNIASEATIVEIENESIKKANDAKKSAWKSYTDVITQEMNELKTIYNQLIDKGSEQEHFANAILALDGLINPSRRELMENLHNTIIQLSGNSDQAILKEYYTNKTNTNQALYTTHLYNETNYSALKIPAIKPEYNDDSPLINGFEIINKYFDVALSKYPEMVAFGEDVGQIGDVNQGFAGLQQKYGVNRVFDTGIREATIMGQGIGLSMRGFRPIAEIQYLDYLLFGLQTLSDDLATLHYRSAGQQVAPLIIRTRGHRLEGIWHTGSPMGMMIHSLRGMYILVPRNMTQAAGFYNTMLQSKDPAIIVECLNGYRLKEKLPNNLGEFTLALGMPEILISGMDLTLVTYGSCVRVAQEAVHKLKQYKNISVELIDVQSLLPFDIESSIVESLKKTNRILFLDEDVPGGATAYMMQEVLEQQGGYQFLDAKPRTITAKANRGAYGSDGDYYCKPQVEEIFDTIVEMILE